jgi:acetolactate synthase-1/2/3 large subunit
LPGYRPDLSPTPNEYAQALELIHSAKRPVILAGHGIILSGAMREVRHFAERANIPVGDHAAGHRADSPRRIR